MRRVEIMFCVQYIQWTMVISILYQIVRNILDSSQDVYQYLHNYSTRPKRHIFLDFVTKQFSNFTTYISPPVLWCFKLKALKPFPQRFICQKSFNISFAFTLHNHFVSFQMESIPQEVRDHGSPVCPVQEEQSCVKAWKTQHICAT